MKNAKNIYELLNHIEINLEDYAKEELNDMEKQKLRKAFKRRQNRIFNSKKIGVVAVALLLALGFFTQTDLGKAVYAATENKLAEISYSIGEALGIEKNIEPYSNVVNQVVESNGIEMKLTDAIIDKDELILSIITNTNKPVEGINFDYDIFINGKKIMRYGATGVGGAIDDSKTRFFSAYSVNIAGIDTAENINIKVALKNLTYYTGNASTDKVKGKWEFEFTANGSELTANTYTVALDYAFNIGNEKYTLEEFRYNPVNQKIFGKVKDRSERSYEIDLRGKDNLGNEVEFFLTSVSGEDLVFKYQNLDGDLSDEITAITLTPYAARLPEKSGRSGDNWEQAGETFTISLNQ
ncbi:hypothetical protein OXPF_29540 [Oxobacter pfennigii]|uniref:DUF4179 domain-containing protein n=1 Tax=Oxobacter pfennigii TaxID=36849 RepID=A0A0P8W4K9_9CLOT|nr:DUF4179 domain-containing protein [Oxobacter pfennigii]KPU43513.1 hypothetical protein OXPF_29540 [Oxobacter pfennigii]